jgi:hypothetical protein
VEKKSKKNRRAAVYRGIFTAKTRIEERRATRRPRKFRRRIPRGNDRHRTNSIEIPRAHSTEIGRRSIARTPARTTVARRAETRRTTCKSVNRDDRPTNGRPAGTNDAYVVRQTAREHVMEPTDELAADAATRRHRCGCCSAQRATAYIHAKRVRSSVVVACTEKSRQRVHSPTATRSFVRSPSDGTFHRLGTRRRREFADKQSKLSWGAMKSGRYGIIAATAVGCCGSSVDPRPIADRRLRSAKTRNDARTRRQNARNSAARGCDPRADRHDKV